MSLLPKIRPATEAKKIQNFIKKTLKSTNHEKVVIALSGGIDSSTTLALAASALGSGNVFVIKMPYNKTHPKAIKCADIMIKHVKIPKRNVFEVNIGPSVERIWKAILIKCSRSQTGQTKLTNLIRLGNIMARVRMVFVYDMAKARKALAVGTENRSEAMFGYFTRFGDAASDIEPINHLYKTQVRQLAEFLKLPQDILVEKPTAGLWVDQTDREELGFSYFVGDQVLHLRYTKKITPTQIAKKLHKSAQKKSALYWKRRTKKVLDRVESSTFKPQLPYHL